MDIIYVPERLMSEHVRELPSFEDSKVKERLMLVHRSTFHEENFMRFQMHGIELGASVLPVTSIYKAVDLVKRLIRTRSFDGKLNASHPDNVHDQLLKTVMAIPGISKREASAILKQHKSIAGVMNYFRSLETCGSGSSAGRIKKTNDFFKKT